MTDGTGSIIRRAASGVGLLVLAACLVIAADLFGTRAALFGSATPPPRASAFSRIDTSAAAQKSVLRSQPWWQQVGRYRGTGTSVADLFRIADGAIQWRVTWSCRKGRFIVRTPGEPRPLIDEPCTERRTTELTRIPSQGLQVQADGRWAAHVEQQVDVPLVERPLAAMTAAGTTAGSSRC